ncbi:MAG: hypothetical protein A4E59_01381 [Syntrophorhabdus sp. PtaB.Bin027]|nr:MAG: hypothetical protein A4E59_01381 [Syntrophorhabdus sp. PtaB.Bin027]
MDSFIFRQSLVVFILDLNRAVFHTHTATCTFVFIYISWFLNKGYLKISCFSCHLLYFSIRQYLYVGVPAAFHKFRRFNAHGAVIGGKGLVELGHMAADGR